MHVKQYRWNSRTDATLSVVIAGSVRLNLIERPWIEGTYPGGKPFESCIPSGQYEIEPFERPNGDNVIRLVNEGLGVYRDQVDLPGPGQGRYLILWHKGNWAKDVVGCGAPGTGLAWDEAGNPMVTSSKSAMNQLMLELGDSYHTLEIIEL